MTNIGPLKILHYRDRLRGPVRPIHWDVDPSTVCDHRCTGCPYIYEGDVDPMLGIARPQTQPRQRAFLDWALYRTFLGQAVQRGAQAITFVGGGEPTLHPRFTAMMSAARSAGCKFGVVTHLGRERYTEAFFAELAHATWVRVSLNAATAGTYARHQGKPAFAQVTANIEAAIAAGTYLGVSFLVTPDNYREIVAAAAMSQALGARYIQYKPLVTTPLQPDAVPEGEVLALLRDARAFGSPRFLVLDQWAGRLHELRRHAEKAAFSGHCHVARTNPKLGADGRVYLCCELAYSEEGLLGSLHEESLAAILDRAGQRTEDMARCPHCWLKPLNQAINDGSIEQLSAPAPTHDQEFV